MLYHLKVIRFSAFLFINHVKRNAGKENAWAGAKKPPLHPRRRRKLRIARFDRKSGKAHSLRCSYFPMPIHFIGIVMGPQVPRLSRLCLYLGVLHSLPLRSL